MADLVMMMHQRVELLERRLDDVFARLSSLEPHAAEQAAEAPACRVCGGDGWVCENHPDLPWAHHAPNGCYCGAGMLCRVCRFEDATLGVIGFAVHPKELRTEADRRENGAVQITAADAAKALLESLVYYDLEERHGREIAAAIVRELSAIAGETFRADLESEVQAFIGALSRLDGGSAWLGGAVPTERERQYILSGLGAVNAMRARRSGGSGA